MTSGTNTPRKRFESGERPDKPGMYLALFHGRDGRKEQIVFEALQSQNATTPTSKRGREIIDHAALGIDIHLFVCDQKLLTGKATPFVYQGRVRYESQQGSRPMSVVFRI